MSDQYDSDEDFVLPPLPSKPQKSIKSFFGGKDTKPKSKSSKGKSKYNTTDSRIEEQTIKINQDVEMKDTSDSLQSQSESLLYMEPVSNKFNKIEPVAAPFPQCNHIIQEQTKSKFEENKTNLRQAKELLEKDIPILREKFDDSSWKSLLKIKEIPKPTTNSIYEEKSIERCLEDLEHSYPDIPVQKLFQQYLTCQKKIIMADLKKVQSAKVAVESIWSRQHKIEEAEKLALEEKRKAEEKEKEIANEGKDIRKMFSKKPKRPAKQKTCNETDDKDASEAGNKEVSTKKQSKKGKKSIRDGSHTHEDTNEEKEVNKPMKVSLSGLFGKKKKLRSKRNTVEDTESTEKEVSEVLEPVESKPEGRDITTMLTKVPSKKISKSKQKVEPSLENENQSPEEKVSKSKQKVEPFLENENQSPEEKVSKSKQNTKPSQENENQSPEEVASKSKHSLDNGNHTVDDQSLSVVASNESVDEPDRKRRKSKKGLDFLKIKFVDNTHEKEDVEVNKVPSKDIRTMFAKAKPELVTVEKIEIPSILPEEKLNEHTQSLLDDMNMDVDIEIEGTNEEQQGKSSLVEQGSSEITANINIKPKSGLLSYFSKSVKIENEVVKVTNRNEESDPIAVAESESTPSDHQIDDPIQKEKDAAAAVITDASACKVLVSKVATPTPCTVEAEDISSMLPESATKLNRKRKRSSLNGHTEPLGNKLQKQSDAVIDDKEIKPEIKSETCGNIDVNTSDNTVLVAEESVKQCVEQDEKADGRNLRRSSRSRKMINYNESQLLSEAIKDLDEKPTTEVKIKKKDKDTDKEVPQLLDQSVYIVNESKKVEKEGERVDRRPPVTELCFPESPKKKMRPVVDLVLDEITMNSFLSWTDKYQPIKARHVIGDKNKTKELFTWLCSWKEKHESIIKKMAERASRVQKKRGGGDSDSDFSDESDDEELLSNTLVLTGPTGCGTTAAVLACAKQMDFKVLELNPSLYRTGKNMYDLVSEAVVSHRIHKKVSKAAAGLSTFVNHGKQAHAQDAMSLVLVEQADIVYEEVDRGFWQGLHDLRRLAKRPMILTANDERILQNIHTDENQHTECIQFNYPTTDQILPMMQIMCLCEHVFVPTSLLASIIKFCQHDVRKTLLQLHFWFDQGKQPLFKSWKKSNNINNDDVVVDVETVSVATVHSTDSRLTNENIGVDVTDNNIDKNCVTTSNENNVVVKGNNVKDEVSDDGLTAKICCIDRLPLFEEEDVIINVEKITEKDFLKCRRANKHYTFVKRPKIASSTRDADSLSNICTQIENLSEIDATLHYKNKNTPSHKDNFVRSTMVDSLSDELWKESCDGHTYPDKNLCECIEDTYLNCYERVNKTSFRDGYGDSERSCQSRGLYTGIQSRLPLSSHLDRQSLSLHVAPYLRNICSSEEERRTVQRRQRRFLHYLDTTGICFTDEVLQQLKQISYPEK